MALQTDILIIGFGIAGQILTSCLGRPSRSLRVLVLEKETIKSTPKQFVFPKLKHISIGFPYITSLQFIELSGHKKHLLSTELVCLNAQTLQDHTLEHVHNNLNLDLIEQVRIDEMDQKSDRVCIKSSIGEIQARYVFDTRPDTQTVITTTDWTVLSWLACLKTNQEQDAQFALSAAGICDHGVEFNQQMILPGKLVLNEQVRLCPPGNEGHGLKDRLLEQIEPNYDIQHIIRTVQPIRPGHDDKQSGRIYHIRSGAPGIRFTAGMELLRIMDWAERNAYRLSQGLAPAPITKPSVSARLGYQILLRKLKQSPHAGANWINHITKNLNGDQALLALSGQASLPVLSKLIVKGLTSSDS